MSRSFVPWLIVLALIGCDGPLVDPDAGAQRDAGTDAGPPPPPVDHLPPPEADNAVGPSDPLFEGQQRFYYDAFGTERIGRLPPAAFLLELMEDEPEVFGDQLAGFGFVPDPSDDLPVGLKRGLEDPERLHETCALCHVARLPDGRTWIGAPNVALEWSRFLLELDARWVAAGNPAFLGELERTKLAAMGPGRTSAESDEYELPVPADFPTYFSLGQRTALNYLGTGANLRTEAFLSVYTFGAGNPNPREAIVPFPSAERIEPMLAFLGQLEAPAAPPQDAALVEAGRAVYERERCDDCHHVDDPSALGVVTYDYAEDGLERLPGDDPDFPNGSIRTSAAHRILIDGDGSGGGDTGFRDLLMFISSNGLRVRISDGYRASDLHMLWFTAPYLHNGSVPTLEDLLRPAAERPTTFVRGTFTVDTTQHGNDNVGHELGTSIDDADRAALAAYLRSL